MFHDFRFAFRLLWRESRHTLSVCLTMALAIGATTLLFAVTYGVLMKPLPWPNASRLVLLNETRGGNPPRFGAFSNAAFHAWRDSPRTVEGLAAWSQRSATLTGSGDPERIRVVAASASLFQALGVTLLIGSPFTEADETAARGPVVVLSEHLWRQRFSADPGVLGRAVQLDGQAHTVVGVLADAAAFPDRTIRAWLPFRVPPVAGNSLSMFNAIAAVRSDSTPSQAAAEGTSRGRDVPDTAMTTTAIFGSNGAVGVTATPMQAAVTADVRRPLMVLLAAVGLLLLAATANVASLQLARATTRRREMAIRAALGAAGGRAMRQLLVESLMLGLTGGAAGLLLASLLHRSLPSLLPADFPRATDLAFDSRVVAFALLASLVTSLRVRRAAGASGPAPGPCRGARRGRRRQCRSFARVGDRTDPAGHHGRSGRRGLRAAGGRFAARAQLREHAQRGPRLRSRRRPGGTAVAAGCAVPARAPPPAPRQHPRAPARHAGARERGLHFRDAAQCRRVHRRFQHAWSGRPACRAGVAAGGLPRADSGAGAAYRQRPRVHAVRHRHVAARRDRQPGVRAPLPRRLGAWRGSADGCRIHGCAPACHDRRRAGRRAISVGGRQPRSPRSTIRSCSCDGV